MSIEIRPLEQAVFEKATVDEIVQDGTVIGYRLTAEEGFVICDERSEEVEPKIDPVTGLPLTDGDGNIVEVVKISREKQITVPASRPLEGWGFTVASEEVI